MKYLRIALVALAASMLMAGCAKKEESAPAPEAAAPEAAAPAPAPAATDAAPANTDDASQSGGDKVGPSSPPPEPPKQ